MFVVGCSFAKKKMKKKTINKEINLNYTIYIQLQYTVKQSISTENIIIAYSTDVIILSFESITFHHDLTKLTQPYRNSSFL